MKIKVGFYQFNPIFGKKDDNFDKLYSVIKNIQKDELDFLVLPEFFAVGYQFISIEEVANLSEAIPGGRTTEFLLDLACKKDFYIAAGLPEKQGERFYNSAILIGPEGFIGSYRKIHLFFEEKLYFTPGDSGFRVWDTKIGKIGLMICFDWFFPESMRTLALMGAEIVAHPSNLILPYCPQAMPIRCLENRLYAITANRTGFENRIDGKYLKFIGQSQITSYDGKILVKATSDEEVLLIAEIEPEKAKNKSINPMNDLLKDRRPDMYAK